MADDLAVPVETAAGVDLNRLTAHLTDRLTLAGPLSVDLIHGGRSNLTYRLTDGFHDWVLRRPPLGNVLPSAHDMSSRPRSIASTRRGLTDSAVRTASCSVRSAVGSGSGRFPRPAPWLMWTA
jgi:aminoglycoside phosphotransferase (APT) family kinase protein